MPTRKELFMFAVADFQKIQREFEYKRNEANKEFLREKNALYQNHPRLLELDQEIRKIGIESAKLSLSAEKEKKELLQKTLTEKLKKCTEEKENILKTLHFSMTPQYSCHKCKDTGYIVHHQVYEMCTCMKQKLISEAYHNSNLYTLKNENFQNFSYDYYEDVPNIKAFQSDISPKENMKRIVEISKEFINNFESETQKNLFFTGTPGTGKTFLSSCIASELINSGYTVLYQTAPLLLDSIFEYKYDKNNANKALYNNFFDVNLLIIDDLGTENLTAAKFQELFTLLNARLLKPNTKTIISTNLSLEEFHKNYDLRMLSRIIGNYNICRFYGKDIRLLKVHS